MMVLKHTALLIFLMISVATPVYGGTVKAGEPAPTFVLKDGNGKNVNMKNLLDRPTVMYFTHNACHYCTQIIAMLKRAEAKFGTKSLRIMGINVMAKDQRLVKAYQEELDFTFPMLAGNRGDVLKAYKINYVPVLVFVDANKTVNKVVGHYIHEPELHDNIREIMGQ
jgi:peroxiredoxin